jgi:hypothetical protein
MHPARTQPLLRLRSSWAWLSKNGRPAEGQGVNHEGSGCGSRQSHSSQEPGRHLRKRGRQPKGPLLSAPFFEIEPLDPQAVYALAFAYKELKDIDNAEMYFKKLPEMEATGELHGLARNRLREIAAQEFKAMVQRWMLSSISWMLYEFQGQILPGDSGNNL